jgi:signal transduction histidine kinase
MGIAIAARAIANHGGELTIESVPGTGTTVTIGIPHHA